MPQPFRIKTPLPERELMLESFSCSEALSTLTQINASLLSPRGDIDANLLLGQPVAFEITLRDATLRHFNGFVTRFAQTGASGRFHRYQAVVRPWLWFLTRTTDCRVFPPDKKAEEIVKTVFADHPIALHEFRLFREYRAWEYCVQYRESDFNFVSRLLEHEGIYYRFDHGDGQHRLMLTDSNSAHDAQPDGADVLPFFATAGQAPPDIDFVSRWSMTRSVQPGKFATTDYDFKIPRSDLLVEGERERSYDLSDFETFDFPGGYTKTADGLHYLENRRDETQARFEVFSGTTNAQALRPGFTFKLRRHPREDQNTEYLVTGINIQADNGSFEADQGSGAGFNCEFSAIVSSQQYRPPRRTPKPFVQGPQTATVVGAQGDEIHTDKFGRVRVQFHWDRLARENGKHGNKKNEKLFCLVRVAQAWAGKGFGAMFIPRVGQEVIVDFLEGDPDQPIITGSVYNGDNPPPWKLPDHATQSGFLTRSSKGGAVSNANMIQFEDKKGSEALNLHAERNMSTSVEADQSTSVGHDRSVDVTHHETHTVGHGREVTVKADGETYLVTGKRLLKVTGDEERQVTVNRKTIVGGEYSEYADGKRLCWNKVSYTFSAERAFFDAGPEYYLQGFDLKFKAAGNTFMESGGTFNAKAAKFKFSATGNINFTCNNFNRTIFQGNDTVLGPNTNTYIGVSRSTTMGPSTEIYSGMSNTTSAGIAIESFMGMQVSNCLALTMSNAVAISIENAALNLGMTGLDLATCGLGIENNAIKMLNGGGGAGAGAAASAAAGPPIAALMAAAVGGGFALGFGGAAAVDARAQAEKDLEKLQKDESLTPAVKARLQRVLDSRFSHPTAESYEASIPAAEIAAETAKLAEDTPGATPSGNPFPASGPGDAGSGGAGAGGAGSGGEP